MHTRAGVTGEWGFQEEEAHERGRCIRQYILSSGRGLVYNGSHKVELIILERVYGELTEENEGTKRVR